MTTFGRSFEDAVSALELECARCHAAVDGLPTEGFDRPTRCPGWSVRILLGHLWRDVDRVCAALSQPEPATVTADAVSYWRTYDPAAAAAGVSERAVEASSSFVSERELASAFAERARECVAAARAAGGGRVVSVRTASLSLEEYVATRVVEAVIHGLDLARALDRDPWTTPLGADIASAVLGGLLPKGSRRPAIDDVAFLEAATGRLPLSDELRAAFGRAADALPLIS